MSLWFRLTPNTVEQQSHDELISIILRRKKLINKSYLDTKKFHKSELYSQFNHILTYYFKSIDSSLKSITVNKALESVQRDKKNYITPLCFNKNILLFEKITKTFNNPSSIYKHFLNKGLSI